MDQKSQDKCLKVGFTIIRKDDSNGARIKQKTQARDQWHTYRIYSTKAERDRAFESLLESQMIISD